MDRRELALRLERLEDRTTPTAGRFAIGDVTGDKRADFIIAPVGAIVAATDVNADGAVEVWVGQRRGPGWREIVDGICIWAGPLGPRNRALLDRASTLQTRTELAREQAAALGVTEATCGSRAIALEEWQHIVGAFARVPANVRAYLATYTAGYQVFAGDSVVQHPAYAYLAGQTTWDGRPWETVPGVGGMNGRPSLAVLPREPMIGFRAWAWEAFWEFRLLHEYGHLVDLAALPAFSDQAEWTSLNAADVDGQPLNPPAREVWADYFARVLQGRPVPANVAAYFGRLLASL
jgi:hypothetical protein